MSKDTGGPAFPKAGLDPWGAAQTVHVGMSRRDYFAAHAPISVADANDAFYRMNGRNAGIAEMLEMLATLRGMYANAAVAESAK